MRLNMLGIGILAVMPQNVLATIQVPDTIRYKVGTHAVLEYPLAHVPWKDGKRVDIDDESTGNRKGYSAAWEIRDSKLYLVSFEAKRQGNDLNIGALLPGGKLPTPARWYTGKLHICVVDCFGPPLKPRFERLVILEIQEGIVLGSTEKRNSGRDDH